MVENPLDQEKPSISLLSEVQPIEKSRGIMITKREEIKDIVEQPLVKAIEAFWDKNIKTHESSANNKNIDMGFGWIRIDFDSLSKENQKISKQYGEPQDDLGENILEIKIPISKSETVNQISDKAVDIANTFQKQPAIWIPEITLEDRLKHYEERFGGKYPEVVAQEKERLNQEGAWEEECEKLGYYLDTETQIAYTSEEHYKKAKGGSEV